MKLLFLRGAVPTDRNPKQIMFDDIEKCDDMWTQLASQLCADDYGEVWYWGGKREVQYRPNFVERWIPNFKVKKFDFSANVIIARGGFSEFDHVLERYAKSIKVYYGAGRRFLPQSGYDKYNLILMDSPAQLHKANKRFPSCKCVLMLKPAADNIFKPVNTEKKYDVIIIGNEQSRDIKGLYFALARIPTNLKVLHVGISSKKLRKRFKHVKYTGWIPRCKIPEYYGMSKIAAVCADEIDSCPRIIPESLACNCPLLVLQSVRLWHDRYVVPETGMSCTKQDFQKTLLKMVREYQKFTPRSYYESNLSLECSAKYVRSLIESI